ncbi:MAG: ExbD/TolR family protein [Planctomycetota bacterium]|jgi:biopolymer transport protein ExbD
MGANILNRLFAGRPGSFTLRMAPMIDMIFLLLIFFVVAGKWRPQEDFLPFRLPAAQAAGVSIAIAEPLQIEILPDGTGCLVKIGSVRQVEIDQADMDGSMMLLAEKIGQVLARQRRYPGDPVEISCDGKVEWQVLARIYNLLFAMGMTDITFIMTEQAR